MNKIIAIASVLIILLASCEIFTIGKPVKKKKQAIDISRDTPTGAVMLFKYELDSNNIPAATRILADSTGKLYLALQQYELYEEVARVGRLIGRKKVMNMTKDSISPTMFKVNLSLDEGRDMLFTTTFISDMWYIIKYE